MSATTAAPEQADRPKGKTAMGRPAAASPVEIPPQPRWSPGQLTDYELWDEHRLLVAAMKAVPDEGLKASLRERLGTIDVERASRKRNRDQARADAVRRRLARLRARATLFAGG
jgi:hypothetical protein